ncbi:MAG: DUF3291 domain-containing protein [Bacteroidota bacterium]
MQCVTVSLFRYEHLRHQWWAFTQMQLAYPKIQGAAGLQFFKMLGTGGDRGFSIFPNFKVYGLLSVWESEADARHFFDQNKAFQQFCQRSEDQWTVYLKTIKAQGEWAGENPFESTATYDSTAPVAVLTRATIYAKHLHRFWKYVPRVSKSIHAKKGLLFSVGVGELPLIQQATFSLWESSDAMIAYAYKSQYHKEVVQKTRELGWYKEELFARFVPYKSEGSWEGKDLLAPFLRPIKI